MAIARPTPASLPYSEAVSMLPYPHSIAVCTARSVSSSGIRKTPKPICGKSIWLFSWMLGTDLLIGAAYFGHAQAMNWPTFHTWAQAIRIPADG